MHVAIASIERLLGVGQNSHEWESRRVQSAPDSSTECDKDLAHIRVHDCMQLKLVVQTEHTGQVVVFTQRVRVWRIVEERVLAREQSEVKSPRTWSVSAAMSVHS